jgi:hypothetical protein
MTALLLGLLLWQASASDDYFSRGVELARDRRWAEARAAFEAGWKSAPRDKRFPVELAGVSFKLKQFGAAKGYLKSALRIDPEDAYAAEFLATLYMLDGNQEAALKYWNRSGRPRVEQILMDPEPRLDPVLLDRAFAFSPAAVLNLEEYRVTRERLARLGALSQRQLEFAPRDSDGFDIVFRSAERQEHWLSLLRGLPFQTLYPEFYNLRGSATSAVSMVRWDAQKRRVFAAVSGPVSRDPGMRYRLFTDGRNENWNVPGLDGFNLEKVEGGVGLESIVNSRWEWAAEVGTGTRKFRNSSLPGGASIRSDARVRYRALTIPERRFTLISGMTWRVGRTFAKSLGLLSQGQGSLEARWFPHARGDDFATVWRIRAGTTFGKVPFDELFMLGLERDTDLYLRAHIGTENGQKGSAPIGRSYVLTNWELDKTIYSTGFVTLSAGPFLDSGRAYGTPPLGSGKWLWDAGAQAKVRAPGGFTVVFSYGKDLRTGRNAFYARVEP